jgi:hypothetical protein
VAEPTEPMVGERKACASWMPLSKRLTVLIHRMQPTYAGGWRGLGPPHLLTSPTSWGR